jgi:hypothetical protein
VFAVTGVAKAEVVKVLHLIQTWKTFFNEFGFSCSGLLGCDAI